MMQIQLFDKQGRTKGTYPVTDNFVYEHPIVIFNSRMWRHHSGGRYEEWQPPRLADLVLKNYRSPE
jgi:hypothetical protein